MPQVTVKSYLWHFYFQNGVDCMRLKPENLQPRPAIAVNGANTNPGYRCRLSPSQRIFVYEAIKEITNGKSQKSFAAAARRAGYSQKNSDVVAARLMKHPLIKAEIEKQMKKIEGKTLITAASVLENIKEIGERCMQKIPVLDSEGKPTGVWKFDSQSALRSQELLGKNLELFTDKVKQSGEVKINVVVKEENVGKMEKKI